MKPMLWFAGFLLLLLQGAQALAASQTQTQLPVRTGFESMAVSAALGGAGVAANDVGETVLLNPALVAHSSKVALGAFYQPRANTFNLKQDFGFSLVDNHTNATFPGGAAYFRNSALPGYTRQEHFHLLTGRFIKGQLAAGLSLTHVRTLREATASATPSPKPEQQPVRNPRPDDRGGRIIRTGAGAGYPSHPPAAQPPVLRPSDSPGLWADEAASLSKRQLWTQWNMALGLHWNPWPQLAVAAVYDNLLPEPADIPKDIKREPRVTLGLMHIATDYFRWRLDASHHIKQRDTFKAAGGVEVLMRRFFALRAGARWAAQRFVFTGGLGFVGPRFHLNYALRDFNTFQEHSFNLLIFF